MENVFTEIISSLQYGFVQKAVLGGVFTALSCSILGVFLVLKKHSFIGDGLAHISFTSVAVAFLMGASPLLVSLPTVILASLLILKIDEKAKINSDAAVALVASFIFAVGVIVISISKGFNLDIYGYLFGSILAITNIELIISGLITLFILSVIILFYNELFVSVFDSDFALVSGVETSKINYIMAVITSITIVTGIKVVGTMLISSMIVFPAVTALQISRGFKNTVFLSAVIAVSSVISGILCSLLFNIPAGASIVVSNGIIFAAVFLGKIFCK